MFSSAHWSSAIYVHIIDVQEVKKKKGGGEINTNIRMEIYGGSQENLF